MKWKKHILKHLVDEKCNWAYIGFKSLYFDVTFLHNNSYNVVKIVNFKNIFFSWIHNVHKKQAWWRVWIIYNRDTNDLPFLSAWEWVNKKYGAKKLGLKIYEYMNIIRLSEICVSTYYITTTQKWFVAIFIKFIFLSEYKNISCKFE